MGDGTLRLERELVQQAKDHFYQARELSRAGQVGLRVDDALDVIKDKGRNW